MSEQSDIEEIKGMVKEILDRLSRGDTTFATLSLRVRILEMLVYGGVGLTLTIVIGSTLYGLFA